MWPNPLFPADLVIFTRETLNRNLIIYAVIFPGFYVYSCKISWKIKKCFMFYKYEMSSYNVDEPCENWILVKG